MKMTGRNQLSVIAGTLFAMLAYSSPTIAADSVADLKTAKNKPAIRGGIVFKSYCVLCHGERGDGSARAEKLYGAPNLAIKARSKEYYDKIVRQGGAAVNGSLYMPPWAEELSDEQISDVVAYLELVGDGVRRGEIVYKTNCVLCHGVNADGKGRASVLYDPPPADLVRSDKNDVYKEMIIREGGAFMGRSDVMPPWGLQLSGQEIKDVVDYLRTVVKIEK